MALRRIALRDFVIVEALEIDFATGFTALTGETGAGKSILVDALQLVMGARADASVVRASASRADLVAEFDQWDSVRDWLADGGFEFEEPLLLRRTIEANGKSRGWINGTPATATQLRALGSRLVDIHGQHAWQNLMTPGSVRRLLDAYAEADASSVLAAWNQWRDAARGLEAARQVQVSAGEERDRLQWQISELAVLSPGDAEWDELNAQHTRLGHAQALMDAAQTAAALLDADDAGARHALTQAREAVGGQEHLEPRFRSITSLLSDGLAQTEEALHELHAYLRRDALDAEQLQQLDARVSLWIGLARRFKRSPAELPLLLAGWKTSLSELEASSDLQTLERAERAAHSRYASAAETLTRQRQKASKPLSNAVTELLQTLGMAGGTFAVQLANAGQPGPQGMEDVEFLVAGHTGQELRPIGKVASGGELSRVALAIAVTTSAIGSAGTLIFDEVDAGVGGVVAHTVGHLMQRLGAAHQVLAVTHLAQVAACADHHLVVTKKRGRLGSASGVSIATGAGRTTEIARMLGGAEGSITSLAHAQEMLDLANTDIGERPPA